MARIAAMTSVVALVVSLPACGGGGEAGFLDWSADGDEVHITLDWCGPSDEVRVASLVETEEEVVVVVEYDSSYDEDCAEAITVQLAEPLGDRRLVNGR